jgi:hypothetical protein
MALAAASVPPFGFHLSSLPYLRPAEAEETQPVVPVVNKFYDGGSRHGHFRWVSIEVFLAQNPRTDAALGASDVKDIWALPYVLSGRLGLAVAGPVKYVSIRIPNGDFSERSWILTQTHGLR